MEYAESDKVHSESRREGTSILCIELDGGRLYCDASKAGRVRLSRSEHGRAEQHTPTCDVKILGMCKYLDSVYLHGSQYVFEFCARCMQCRRATAVRKINVVQDGAVGTKNGWVIVAGRGFKASDFPIVKIARMGEYCEVVDRKNVTSIFNISSQKDTQHACAECPAADQTLEFTKGTEGFEFKHYSHTKEACAPASMN